MVKFKEFGPKLLSHNWMVARECLLEGDKRTMEGGTKLESAGAMPVIMKDGISLLCSRGILANLIRAREGTIKKHLHSYHVTSQGNNNLSITGEARRPKATS